MGGNLQFSESVPEATAAFVRDAWGQAQSEGKAMSPMEFMDRFEATLSAPVVDLATRLRGEKVPVEQMESAGAISDFDEDSIDTAEADSGKAPPSRKVTEFRPYGGSNSSTPWVVWAAAAVVILAFGAWFWLDRSGPPPIQQAATTASKTEGPSSPPVPKANDVTRKLAVTDPASASKPVEKPVEKKEPAKPAPPAVIAASKPVEKAPDDMPKAPAPVPAVKPAPANAAEKDPVTIRKALLPTPEELEKMKQGHVQRQIGQLPDQNTASPLIQARN
jgi:hypothetical protein